MRHNSLLGQAIAAQRARGWDIPPFIHVLDMLAKDERAAQEWDRVIARAKPRCELELAGWLIDCVALASAESARASTTRLNSAEEAARCHTEEHFKALFAALEVLEQEFHEDSCGKVVDLQTHPPFREGARLRQDEDDNSKLLNAVIGRRVAAEGGQPPEDPVALAHFEHAHFRLVTAPKFLKSVRKHLEQSKSATRGVPKTVPLGRTWGKDAKRRAFVLQLEAKLPPLLGKNCNEFVTVVTNIMFPDDDEVYTLEAVKALIGRRRDRDAKVSKTSGSKEGPPFAI